jgi:hypothetical protein
MGPLMKLPSVNMLSVLLIGTLLLCHGIFGALHLVCDPLEWCAGAQHSAEHKTAAGAVGDAHEHPADHGTSPGYFAVLVGLLGLLLGLLPKGTPLRIRLDARWPAVFRRVRAVFRPPPTPTPLTLQVFRL